MQKWEYCAIAGMHDSIRETRLCALVPTLQFFLERMQRTEKYLKTIPTIYDGLSQNLVNKDGKWWGAALLPMRVHTPYISSD